MNSKWEWLFRRDEDGLSALEAIIALAILFLIVGFAGGIERGLIFP